MKTILFNVPIAMREAFLEALYSAIRSSPASTLPQQGQSGTKAMQFLTASQSMPTSLVHVQAMLLMAIESANYGPSTMHGQGGPPPSQWLGSAVGLAYSLKLHVHKQPDKASENDPDSEENIARRVWWSLVVMDKWNALSTGSPGFIPDGSVVVYPEDEALLGDALYQLARKFQVLQTY